MDSIFLKIMLPVLALLLFLRESYAVEIYKGLIIATTENIRLNSEKLDEFIKEKENRGFTVKIATEKDFGDEELKGYEKAQLIRSWLKENSSGYSFLLLIGDPNPKMGDIPMVVAMPGGPDVADPCADTAIHAQKYRQIFIIRT